MNNPGHLEGHGTTLLGSDKNVKKNFPVSIQFGYPKFRQSQDFTLPIATEQARASSCNVVFAFSFHDMTFQMEINSSE